MAGDEHVAGMVADVTGLTEHEYQSRVGTSVGMMLFGVFLWFCWKRLWEVWPFVRAKSWVGAVFFLLGFLTCVTELGRGQSGSIAGAVIFCGIGVWLFTSGVSKTKFIVGHLSGAGV